MEPKTDDDMLTKREIDELVQARLTPGTRRWIIGALFTIAVTCILAEVALAVLGHQGSDALMAVASGCVGGIAGIALPNGD